MREVADMESVRVIADLIAEEDLVQRRIERSLDRYGFARSGYKVTVFVRNGIAHLSGSVRYEEEIAAVGALVSKSDGITGVVNRILYREPPSADRRADGKEER